ncbi:MAG TPA: hypothetical protein VFQ53_25160 [Kofleriaceae bacterium]|nr:hypothetical protein [Kofleriaceae bacterium]
MRGEAGDDTITASASVTVPLVLDGGDGNDRLVGGSGADRLSGGAGNDVIEGRQGADTVQLGDGDDTALWNPGDGSDVIDGESGSDALVMQGANVDETFELRAAGSRVTLLRSIAAIALDLGGLERITIRARAGADTLFVGDLTGTPVTDVELALSPDGSALTDGVIDTVHVSGSAADDAIALTGAPGLVTLSGLSATVRITQPDTFDLLVVHGLGGSDTFAATGVDGVMTLSTVQD